MNKSPTTYSITPLYARLAGFTCALLIVVGIFSYRTSNNQLHENNGFWIYAALGQVLVFSMVILAILAYRKKDTPHLPRWSKWNLIYFGWATVFLALDWWVLGRLVAHDSLWLTVVAHLLLLTGITELLLGSFGKLSLKRTLKYYRTELFYSAGAAILFYSLLNVLSRLWRPFATLAQKSVQGLLVISGVHVTSAPARTLLLHKFGVRFEQYCSGIGLLILFIGLFCLVAALDWEKLNHKRVYVAFLIGIGGLLLVNIIRVYMLILGGYFIHISIASQLYHSYSGILVFTVYSALFWKLSYKRLLA